MLARIKKALLNVTAMGLLLVPLAAPVAVSAQFNANCTSINNCVQSGGCPDGGTDCNTDAPSKVTNIIKLVINLFSLIVGVIAVIMIVIGGLKYITSGGDSGNVTGAKNTILYAVVGLVVVALAQIIVRFVLTKATAA